MHRSTTITLFLVFFFTIHAREAPYIAMEFPRLNFDTNNSTDSYLYTEKYSNEFRKVVQPALSYYQAINNSSDYGTRLQSRVHQYRTMGQSRASCYNPQGVNVPSLHS